MKTVQLFANAKINLFLDIESRRNDGYHNILSLMQSVDLHDVVTLSYAPADDKKFEIKTNNPAIPSDQRNIAYKAAERLVDSGHIVIEIEKNIPSPAGLAGGSADAAAVIYGLCLLGACKKNDSEILQIAAKIGADVPFCLVGGTKKISGIGDIIEDVSPIEQLNLVVAVTGEGVSTPVAYSMLDKQYNDFVGHTVKEFNFESFSENDVYNIFEEAILSVRDGAASLYSKMKTLGASTVFMSGSGPSIVGIFKTYDEAENAAKCLSSSGIFAKACRTVEKGIEEK